MNNVFKKGQKKTNGAKANVTSKINIDGNRIILVKCEGKTYINVTSQDIIFTDRSGKHIIIPPCGFVVNVKYVEEHISNENGLVYSKLLFNGDSNSMKFIDKVKSADSSVVIIGTVPAAQAYPGKVFGMVAFNDVVLSDFLFSF